MPETYKAIDGQYHRRLAPHESCDECGTLGGHALSCSRSADLLVGMRCVIVDSKGRTLGHTQSRRAAMRIAAQHEGARVIFEPTR